MRLVHQTKFGNDFYDIDTVGNCYPACIASILNLDLEDVPEIYGKDRVSEDKDSPDNWMAGVDWLNKRGYSIVCFEWPVPSQLMRAFNGSYVILSGKSPRFKTTNHAVVGLITEHGFEIVHDPHPEGTGIDGKPDFIEVITKII